MMICRPSYGIKIKEEPKNMNTLWSAVCDCAISCSNLGQGPHSVRGHAIQEAAIAINNVCIYNKACRLLHCKYIIAYYCILFI